jgi:hypothetical protein
VESSSSGASLDANSGPKTSGRQAAVDPENSSRAVQSISSRSSMASGNVQSTCVLVMQSCQHTRELCFEYHSQTLFEQQAAGIESVYLV